VPMTGQNSTYICWSKFPDHLSYVHNAFICSKQKIDMQMGCVPFVAISLPSTRPVAKLRKQ
jgi:hypothetical protein